MQYIFFIVYLAPVFVLIDEIIELKRNRRKEFNLWLICDEIKLFDDNEVELEEIKIEFEKNN